MRSRAIVISLATTFLFAAAAPAGAAESSDPAYLAAIERAEAMSWDPEIIELVGAHRLDIVNVAWEDTGRFYDSAVGPNISDVTIQVPYVDPAGQERLALMPVIRFPTSPTSPPIFPPTTSTCWWATSGAANSSASPSPSCSAIPAPT